MLTIKRLAPHEQRATLATVLKWTALGTLVGAVAGAAAWLFLTLLERITAFRLDNPTLLFTLPFVGFAVGWVYHRYAGPAARGNTLIIEQLHTLDARLPLRMTPLILGATLLSHLGGASVGREGTAVQMGTSLADALFRLLRLPRADRLYMLLAGVAGGFAGVFGTPLAGFVFALEVRYIGAMQYEAIVPCLAAALTGDLVARALGIRHEAQPRLIDLPLEPLTLAKVALCGIAFGIAALLFIELTHAVKHFMKARVAYSPLRPFIGGIAVIGLTLLVGSRDYNGLSSPLASAALAGGSVFAFAFLLKLVFTALSLGTGFLGGEVTPLFVIGATLGSTLGALLGLPPAFSAALGFVAVFGAASNTPVTCTLLGVELFGGGSAMYLAVACFTGYLFSGHRSIYEAQRISIAKAQGLPNKMGV